MQTTLDITPEITLGELVTFFPAISSQLNALQIDYCCQGERSLKTALQDAGLALDFIEKIREDYQAFLKQAASEVLITELSDAQLVDLILHVHHQPERVLWKELDELVNKILLVHFQHDPQLLLQLHRQFSLLKLELEQHFAKEEKILFPLLQQPSKTEADCAQLKQLIQELEMEHEVAGQLVKQIIQLTGHFSPPDFACPTMKLVYAKLHQLTDDLFLHITKENSVLFKRYLS